jgi:hypothetical protein
MALAPPPQPPARAGGGYNVPLTPPSGAGGGAGAATLSAPPRSPPRSPRGSAGAAAMAATVAGARQPSPGEREAMLMLLGRLDAGGDVNAPCPPVRRGGNCTACGSLFCARRVFFCGVAPPPPLRASAPRAAGRRRACRRRAGAAPCAPRHAPSARAAVR